MLSVVKWHGVIAIEGIETGDGRLIEEGALDWDDSPIPLRYVHTDKGGHENAEVVGKIEKITRDGQEIKASGVISEDFGYHAIQLIENDMMRGVSLDLDSSEVEYDDEHGLLVITSAFIRAATIVQIPAFKDAKIMIDSEDSEVETNEDGSLVASADVRPPREFFDDPLFEAPTPLTIEDDGRVYGHLATFGECHIGYPGACVTAPESASDYSYFKIGGVKCSDGSTVRTGVITMNTNHAKPSASMRAATEHYDNTGMAIADVNVGEDTFGIWVAGSLRPTATEEDIRALRGSALSGDWRRVGDNLELIGALAVNVPGFPIINPKFAVSDDRQMSLVASGVVKKTEGNAKSIKLNSKAYIAILKERFNHGM